MKLLLAASICASLAAPPTPTAKIAGNWIFEFERYENTRFLLDAPNSAACRLKQDDGDLSGDCGSDRTPLMGAIKGRTMVLRVQDDRGTLNGEVSEDGRSISGSWHERERYGKFRATKQ